MTEFYIDPEDAVSDFLRVHMIDPRARAETSETQTFNPGASDTVITLASPSEGSVSCVTEVTIDGATSKKWQDYHWDYQTGKLTFFSAFAGTEEVIVTYKYGTSNWIYSDRPDQELSSTNFPRISIFTVTNTGQRLGEYNAPVEGSIVLQIDIWSKDGYVKTINSRSYSNNYITRYLGNRVTRAFEKFESDLFPLLYGYDPNSMARDAPYSSQYQAFHSIVEVNLKGLSMGRIENT
jgi:hypothetical protein